MLVGHIDRLDRHYLSGWALDTDHPNTPIEVIVLVNGQEWGRVIAGDLREDLEALGTHGDGRHGFTYLFVEPLSLLENYDVTVLGRHEGKTATLRPKAIQPFRQSTQRQTPILVTASGRSGTTILMKYLRGSPSIVVPDKYPYELKLLTYYGHAFDILSSPGNHGDFPGDDGIRLDPFSSGLNPFNNHQFQDIFPDSTTLYDFFERKAPIHLTAAFRSIISDFYHLLGEKSGRLQSRFFAEKTDILQRTRGFARMAFDPVKEIILIRDPRDLFCSYRSFWQSRPEEAIPALKATAERILKIRCADHRDDVIFVKYEDLVLRTERALAEVSGFLELDSPLAPDREADEILFKKHGTSADVSSSVGRWKDELKAKEIQVFESEFAEFFTAFEYERPAREKRPVREIRPARRISLLRNP
ncbi:MAG: sulfotransferase [Rhodopila sp.]|nr:sulfotransferase [Rhodopila sp.]